MHRVPYSKITQIYLDYMYNCMSIFNLKPHGGGYISATEIIVVYINSTHQKLHLISCSLSWILRMAWFIFPTMLSNFCKGSLPFNLNQILILSLKLSTLTFSLILGHHLLVGRQIFTLYGQGNSHLITKGFKHKWSKHGTESFSASTVPHKHVQQFKLFYFWNFFCFFICYFWLNLMKTTCREDPRWQIGHRGIKHELCESETLLRLWSHAWWRWSIKESQNFDSLNP
jgi:hypothetical protein